MLAIVYRLYMIYILMLTLKCVVVILVSYVSGILLHLYDGSDLCVFHISRIPEDVIQQLPWVVCRGCI